ncbi:uncharacterized protein CG5098 [Trichonephila clavipes]|nr:uncharacterized protein CG5098 [Trichonephila clavipes]
MQNTSQTFRGAGAPGVNFSEHAYDNHVGVHCQPTGYQPYTNPPYHPIPSPRPHHYANHQMQSNMPYRHHGGAYAPNQNQYGQNMNQEMYRNHHSGYVGGPNSRNIPSKPWSENNASPDLMSPYGQVSHPQMMNNPSQMPVNSMRSPPHATSNMNPAPTQNQQHFRQMQSPAHSPHSWSQAQIPSPGVMHSSRTTPSPLPAHVRSPGHSQQPFSPPAAHAMNMPPHPQPPENGQIPTQPPMNPAGGTDNHNPSNPLHSLQKMVLLEQDPSKAMLPMMGDGSEQFPNQCGSHNFVPDETVNNESKDSAYSTYYNMDENRFESKPNNTTNDSSYSTVQQVSNCNFPLPSHPLNSEEVPSTATVPSNNNSNMHDALHSVPNTSSPVANSASSAPLAQCKKNIAQNDCTLNLTKCPPHAESAPVFTDQTKAAVSTNSEQALESKSSPNWALQMPSGTNEAATTEVPFPKIAEEPSSSAKENSPSSTNPETNAKFEACVKTQIKQEKIRSDEIKNPCIVSTVPADTDEIVSESPPCDQDKPSDNKNASIKVNCKEEKLDIPGKGDEKVATSTTIKLTAEVHNADDVEIVGNNLSIKKEATSRGDSKKTTMQRPKSNFNYEASPEIEVKEECQIDGSSPKIAKDCNSPSDYDSLPINAENCDSDSLKELARNPVKVVIHRIRKSDTDDTWHVPSTNSKESCNESSCSETIAEKKAESKIPSVGPQIIILSPAVSQKKFGFRSSVASNNVITVSEESSIIETVEKDDDDETPPKKEITDSSNKSFNTPGSDKKRGRPVGSKNKLKAGCVKKKRGRKGSKKKKIEQTKNKVLDTSSKPKRLSKIFNGPYVHIIGSKENPTSIKVINVAQKEEEKLNKIQSKRNFSSTISRIKKKPVGHLSTLSPTYDAFNRDKTWLCVFCHKGSHHGGLGDLYGPYYIKDKNSEIKSGTSTSSPGAARRKRRKSEVDDIKPSKRARQTSVHSNDSTPMRSSSQVDASSDSETSNLREVWIHEDCAVWCQSISLIGEEVQGLEEAVTEASENTCCQCSLQGATVGCWGKGCKEQYHFSCAKEIGCQMDIEKFSLLCPQHQGSAASSATLKETGKVVKTERKSSDRRTRCQ